MKDELSYYIAVYEDVISKEICESTIDQLKEVEWKKTLDFNYDDENATRYDDYKKELNFKTFQINSHIEDPLRENAITQPFEEIIFNCLDRYCFHDYGFDWYQRWYNFTQAIFNKFETGSSMEKHCDNLHFMFDGKWKGVPVYSVIGFLNDDYEGGDLVFLENETVKKKRGSVIVFPSNFLYPHKVTEVTGGTRYTFSSYAY
jgi:hypothetical protein